MIKDYFILSLKNLKRRGTRSWLTMLGIFIGIAAVVSLISMGEGLKLAVTGQFSSLSTDRLVIQNTGTGFGPPGSTSVKKLTEHDFNLIKNLNLVKIAAVRYIRIATFDYNKNRKFVYITNIPKDSEEAKFVLDTLDVKTERGRLLSSNDRGKVLLGNDFTRDDFGKEIKIGSNVVIQGKKFEVIGILKKASTFQINSVAFLPEEDLKDILNIGDEIDIIAVQAVSQKKVEDLASEIGDKLRKDRNLKLGEEDFSVETPLSAIESVNTILNIVNLIVTGIAAISLLVGGIGIANTMYTSVLERTKEIGVMKSVGAKNSDILYIFLLESGLLGLVGGIIGSILGLLLAFFVSSIANAAFGEVILKVQLNYSLLISAIFLSFFIGVMSGVLPAFQASKLNPVEALRK